MTSILKTSAMGLLAACAAMAVAGPTLAADVVQPAEPMVEAPVAIYDWSGPYAGLFAGGAWGSVDVNDLDGYNASGFSYDAAGFYGGALAGFNWQWGSVVGGVEGEISYLGLDDGAQFPDYVGVRLPTDSFASIETDFHAALTARLGYAFNNVLIYAKGGVAGLNTDVSFIDTDPTGLTLISGTTGSEFLVGYTVGAGVEVGFSPNWTVRGEYMFSDFGSITHTASSGGTTWRFEHDLSEVHTGKVVFSYRW